MTDLIGKRAIVIGAGIGGLATAGVLAKHFREVEVVERDRLATSVGSRPGTAQDQHPHGLLAGGLKAIGEIFPGFATDLEKAGAIPVRVGQDVLYERPDVGTLPRRDFDMPLLCASRPLIEFVVRQRVLDVANITLRSACRVTKIVPAADMNAAQGVRLLSESGRWETLEADLIVDASGRGALTMQFFDALDLELPMVSEVGVDVSYATAVVKIPQDLDVDWKLILTLPNPPALAMNAVMTSIEDGRWMVLIADRGEPRRIETWGDFVATLQRLNTQTLYNVLRHVEAPERLHYFGFPASLWRHFERLPGLPRGILPIGDALCRFNPIHGQGMSSAAKQACLLRDAMVAAAHADDPIVALQVGFMQNVGSFLATPWGMSTSADLAFPETRGERPADFEASRAFETALFRAAMVDPMIHRLIFEVSQLLQPFSRLQAPDVLQRMEAAAMAMSA